MQFRDFYIKKTRVDFDTINRAMFVELQDDEHLKRNKLLEQYNRLLQNFSVKQGVALNADIKSITLDNNVPDIVKSGEGFIKVVKKWEELKKKYRNLTEKSFISELLMTEQELEDCGFYTKYPHLR